MCWIYVFFYSHPQMATMLSCCLVLCNFHVVWIRAHTKFIWACVQTQPWCCCVHVCGDASPWKHANQFSHLRLCWYVYSWKINSGTVSQPIRLRPRIFPRKRVFHRFKRQLSTAERHIHSELLSIASSIAPKKRLFYTKTQTVSFRLFRILCE